MRAKKVCLGALLIVLGALPSLAESFEGLPLHVKTIAPGVVRVWVGDYVSSTAVSAVATEKGIVVIDSTELPKLDAAFRKVIARELGRSDFAYLINTHGHADHTNGNGVYADCEIIAHATVPAMMKENLNDIPRLIDWYKEAIPREKEEIASGKLTAEQKAAAEERLVIRSLTADFLASNPQPTLPSNTFTDKTVLDCGDVRFELFQAGGTHTRSDVFVFVPEKGILFTGDMMADKWLTDTPGCLATFAARTGEVADFPVLLKNWRALIERKVEIGQYVPGHWNGELSYDGFAARFEYVKAMLADIEPVAKAGDDFSALTASYTLKDKFPQLVGSPGIDNRAHLMSLQHLYEVYSGKVGLLSTMQGSLGSDDFATKFTELRADLMKNRSKYFYTETDLNSVGYILLQQLKKVDDAVQVFELCVELFPDSWNAHDSLAEGYYTRGEKQHALEHYRKSLDLNPGNDNGRKYVETITKELEG